MCDSRIRGPVPVLSMTWQHSRMTRVVMMVLWGMACRAIPFLTSFPSSECPAAVALPVLQTHQSQID